MKEFEFDLTTWATAYRKKRGHAPLIVGREYTVRDDPAILREAAEQDVNVVVETRFGNIFSVGKEELEWRTTAEVMRKLEAAQHAD